MMYRYGYGLGVSAGSVAFHIFGALLWFVIIALLLYIFIRVISGSHHFEQPESMHKGMHHTPLEILQRRYAKGKITKEKYQEMKKELENSTTTPTQTT